MDEKKKQTIEEVAGISYSIFTADNHCPFDKDCPYLGGKVRFGCNDCLRANLIIDAGYRKENDTAREIFEKIFEVLCCFTTQGKSKEYAEGYIDCLEEVDKRLQNLAKEKYGVDLGE